MSDLFHERLSDEAILAVWAAMAVAHWHTFQVLTKRAERMREWLCALGRAADVADRTSSLMFGRSDLPARVHHRPSFRWPLPNVWLGVSAEDEQRLQERLPELLTTPAAVRFLSAEPLLGPISIGQWLTCECGDWKRNHEQGTGRCHVCCSVGPPQPCTAYRGISWVIVGGETGPGVRACDIEWIRQIVSGCRAVGVSCFVKQLGSRSHDGYVNGVRPLGASAAPSWLKLKDAKGADPAEWPEDLRVRQFPA